MNGERYEVVPDGDDRIITDIPSQLQTPAQRMKCEVEFIHLPRCRHCCGIVLTSRQEEEDLRAEKDVYYDKSFQRDGRLAARKLPFWCHRCGQRYIVCASTPVEKVKRMDEVEYFEIRAQIANAIERGILQVRDTSGTPVTADVVRAGTEQDVSDKQAEVDRLLVLLRGSAQAVVDALYRHSNAGIRMSPMTGFLLGSLLATLAQEDGDDGR